MPLMDWSWHPTRNWKFIPNASEPVTWFQSASLGTKIALSTLTLLALFQTIFFLSLLVMNSMSLAQQRSTKHFQFKLPVFAMGFAGIFLAKLNMVLWGAVLYPGISPENTIFNLLMYLNVWLIVFLTIGRTSVSLFYHFKNRKQGYLKSRPVDASILDHFPDVFIVVPIFREDPSRITKMLDSIVSSDYPKKRMHIFLSFDEDAIIYLDFLKDLGVWETVTKCQFGETVYHGMNVFVTKFYHSGKRSSQKHGIDLIRRIYGQNQNISLDPQLLLCDSDVVWERDAIYNAVCLLEKNSDLVSMSGTRSIKEGVLNVFDGMEVLDSMEKELFYRPFQLSCHVLKDLPGYFTFIRFAAFRDVELRYFDQVDDVEHTNARYHSLSYGNNVYLANVLSETFGANRMGYSPHVRAYHNSSKCWSDYFYTKRRSFLGRLANVTYVLGSKKSLQKSPMLFLSWISDMITSASSLSVLLLFLILLLSGADMLVEWILLAIFVSLRTGVFMFHACNSDMVLIGLSYPLYNALIKPVIDILVLCFAIATWSIKIWGGPRESAHFQSKSPFVINSELKEFPSLPRNKPSAAVVSDPLDDDNLIFDCEQSENRPPLQHSYTRGPEENHQKSKKRMDIRKILMSPPKKKLVQVPECDPLLDNVAEPASCDTTNRESLSSLSLGRDILTALNGQSEVSSILQRKRDSLASTHLGKDIISALSGQKDVSEMLERTKGASSKNDYAPVSTQNLLELEALDPWKPSAR